MRRLKTLILLSLTAAAALAADYATTSARARRFFDNQEWASAVACYNFMLHERPDVPETYGRDIVATLMLNDTVAPQRLLEQAMAHNVPLDSVLTQVRKYSFAVGNSPLYEHFMLDVAQRSPWLARPIDAYLLRYYTFRENAPMMEEYARRMLAGVPDNVQFLTTLAQAYMLQCQTDKAVATWHKILSLKPDNLNAVLQLANFYDLTGQYSEALKYFKQAAALRPTPYVDAAVARLSRTAK